MRLPESRKSHIDKDGREVPDPRPLTVHVDFRPLTLQEQIARLMQAELSRRAAAKGHETFEEANDFEVDEENFQEPPVQTQYTQMEEEFITRDQLDQRMADDEARGQENLRLAEERRQQLKAEPPPVNP